MGGLLKGFLIFAFFFFPFPSSAISKIEAQQQFNKSLQLYSSQKYSEGRNILRELVRAYPKNALYWFNLGTQNYMLKDYANADRSFLQVEKLNSPLTPAARVYRAKCAREAGDFLRAKQILQSALRDPRLTAALREEAGKDLLAIQNKSQMDATANEALNLYREGKYKRALRLLRANKNPSEGHLLLSALILIKLEREDQAHQILKKLQSSAPSSDLHALAGILLDRIRDTYSKPKWLFVEGAAGNDSKTVLLSDFGGGARFWDQDLWYASAGYLGRWRETISESDLRILIHEVQGNFGYEVGTELFMLSPFVAHETWGSHAARLSSGLRFHFRKGNEQLEYGLDADLAFDRALSSEFAYLQGNVQTLKAYAGRVVYPVYGQAYLNVERQDIGDQRYSNGDVLPMAYLGWGPGLRALWKFRREWAVQGSVMYMMRDYPTKSLPTGKERNDREWTISGRVTHFVSPNLSFYGNVSVINNQSTLGASDVSDESYTRTQILAGAVWDAF